MRGANAAWMDDVIAPAAAEGARACDAAGAAVERAESQDTGRGRTTAGCDAAGETEGLIAAAVGDGGTLAGSEGGGGGVPGEGWVVCEGGGAVAADFDVLRFWDVEDL